MDPARYSSQRRPRLLRASATEPSIITSSIVNHGALDMSQPMSHSSSGQRTRDGSVGAGGGYRRATDLLNHVAYLSSCTTSPVSPLGSGPFFDRVVPRRFLPGSGSGGDGSSGDGSRGRDAGTRSDRGRNSRTSTPTRPSAAATPALPESRGGRDSRANRRSSDDEGSGHHDDLLGSSPASTHTSGSLDRLHRHQSLSAHYYSFPSFDTWDPDRQDKEDDDDD